MWHHALTKTLFPSRILQGLHSGDKSVRPLLHWHRSEVLCLQRNPWIQSKYSVYHLGNRRLYSERRISFDLGYLKFCRQSLWIIDSPKRHAVSESVTVPTRPHRSQRGRPASHTLPCCRCCSSSHHCCHCPASSVGCFLLAKWLSQLFIPKVLYSSEQLK